MRIPRIINILLALLFVLRLDTVVLGQVQNRIELDITEVSRMALENNFDIQVYRLDRRISEKELLKAKAVYDTGLDGFYRYNEDRLARSSIIFGERTSDVMQGGTLSKTLPTGTALSLGAEHRRQFTDSAFSSLNPYHESTISVSITQPFGKNALGILDRNTVKIAGLDVDNAVYTSLDKIEAELADTQKAYWNLLLAYKDVELTENMLNNSKDLYAANNINFDIGLVEPPEFYAVEANLKQRQKDVVLSKDKLNSALNLLRFKLNLDKNLSIKTKDKFRCEEIETDFRKVIERAFLNRRDYKAAKNMVKAMDLEVEMKKNSLWPQIDLKGTFKKNGLDREFGESIREINLEDNAEYTAEVIFSFPLENRKAKAEYSQKELEKAKALVNLKKVECLILVQVHDAFIHAKSLYESANLLKEAAELEGKKYLGEEDRFSKGRSGTDRLLRYQHDYLRASVISLRSLYSYKAAIIDLKATMNSILESEES